MIEHRIDVSRDLANRFPALFPFPVPLLPSPYPRTPHRNPLFTATATPGGLLAALESTSKYSNVPLAEAGRGSVSVCRLLVLNPRLKKSCSRTVLLHRRVIASLFVLANCATPPLLCAVPELPPLHAAQPPRRRRTKLPTAVRRAVVVRCPSPKFVATRDSAPCCGAIALLLPPEFTVSRCRHQNLYTQLVVPNAVVVHGHDLFSIHNLKEDWIFFANYRLLSRVHCEPTLW